MLLSFDDLCLSSAQWSMIPLTGKRIDVLLYRDILAR